MVAPILSRIYTPNDFGRLTIYLSVIQVLGSIATGRYELAIVLPKKNRDALNLTRLSITISLSLAVFLFLIMATVGRNRIAFFLGDPDLASWVLLIPFQLLFIGVCNALNFYCIRKKRFKIVSQSNVVRSGSTNLTQLGLGFAGYLPVGLILGQFVGQVSGSLMFSLRARIALKIDLLKDSRRTELVNLAKRYISFPKFSLPGIFVNMLSINIFNLFIGKIFGLANLGQFSYSFRYLTIPAGLIGNAFAHAMFQNLSEKWSKQESISTELIKSLKKLSIITVLIFIPAFFVVEDLFVIIFGIEWKIAGELAQIIIPLVAIRFVVSPISIVLSVTENQKQEFILHFSIFVSTVIVCLLGLVLGLSFRNILYLYTLILSSVYLIVLYWIIVIVKSRESNESY